MYGSISSPVMRMRTGNRRRWSDCPLPWSACGIAVHALKDIAILVRTNQEGALVADTLLAYKEEHPSDRYNYDIISDDAPVRG